MLATTVLRHKSLSVIDYRCSAGPADRPFVERHRSFSVSYVRKGSFGCRTRGESFELVAGSVLVGHPGDEYLCTHEHHAGGDECLSFQLAPALVETIGDRTEAWRIGCVPPLPELMVLGELAQTAAAGGSETRREPWRAIAVARWKRRSGLTRTRTSRSISTAQRARRARALLISCGCSQAC